MENQPIEPVVRYMKTAFEFKEHLPIDECLAKINFPHQFRSVADWEKAEVEFYVHDVGHQNTIVDTVFDMRFSLHQHNLHDVVTDMKSVFIHRSRYSFSKPPKVRRVAITLT